MTEYELHNLVAHLEACGRVDDLHRLLRLEWVTQARHQNAWFAARARNGDVEGFSGDVAHAWRMLDRELLDGRTKPELLAAQIYCALVLASLRTLSLRIPTALIARLVVGEVRTADYGLALARRIPDPAWRGKALALLVPVPPADDREPVVEEVMELIMAPQANLEYIAPVLERAAPYLSAQDAHNILGRVRGVRYQAAKAHVFAALATAMDAYELERAMSEVLEYPDDLKELALPKLARHLPEPVLGAFLRRVLGWPYRAERLAAFAPYLTEQLLHSAEAEIRELTSEDGRTRLLAVLVPFLSLGDQHRVLPEVLRGIERLPAAKRETARAIIDVLPVLTSAQRKEYIGQFVKGCRGYAHGFEAHEALRVIAPELPRAMRRRAIRLARAGTPEECVRGLAALVAGMPPRRQTALAREAIKKSRGIDTAFRRAVPLVELFASLDPRARDAVFQKWLLEAEGPLAAVKAASRDQWEQLWDRLAPLLSPGSAAVLEERLAVATDAGEWMVSLLELGQRVASESTVVARLNSVRPSGAPILVASGLYRTLPAAERTAVVSEAVGQATTRVRSVAALLPYLEPVERLPVIAAEIDHATRANAGDGWRAEVIVATAPYMSDEQLQASLHSSSGLKDDSARATALIGLARWLPDRLVDEALELESAIHWPGDKCEFVATLAQDRPEPKRTELLDKAVLMLDENLRHGHPLSETAAHIASLLTGVKRDHVLQLCLETLRSWAWPSGVPEVDPLMPLWSSAQRRQALEVLRERIEDHEHQDPGDEFSEDSLLIRASFVELQRTFLPETLENATDTIGELAYSLAEIEIDPRKDILSSSRADAVARLARHLDLEAREELAQCAFELVERDLRRRDRPTDLAQTLAAVAMIGDAALVRRLLGEAMAIADDDARARALQALGPRVAELEGDARCLAWCDVLRASAKRTRASLLSDLNALATTIQLIAGQDMKDEIQSALTDAVVAWP